MIRLPTIGVAHSLDVHRRAGVHLARALNCFSLCRLYRTRALRTSTSDCKITAITPLYIKLPAISF